MGSPTHTASPTFDLAVAVAESTRQGVVAAASAQPAVNTAEIAFYRTVKALQIAAGASPTSSTHALLQLGTGGN